MLDKILLEVGLLFSRAIGLLESSSIASNAVSSDPFFYGRGSGMSGVGEPFVSGGAPVLDEATGLIASHDFE